MKRNNGEGSVYPRTNGKGYVGEVVLDGKRRRVSATTRKACADRLRAMIREHEQTGVTPDGKASVRQLVEMWQNRELPQRRKSDGSKLPQQTIDRFNWFAATAIEHIGSVPLRRLSVDDIEAMFTTLAKRPTRPWGRSTLIGFRSMLGQVLLFGERRGLVTRNVARIATIPHEAHDSVAKQALDVEDSRKLWHVCGDHRLGAMWRLGMIVATRPGELAGLTWPSIDLDGPAPSITISREVSMIGGKPTLIEAVKTDGSYRSVGIGSAGVELLQAHRAAQNVERMASRRWANADLVFATSNGSPLDPANVRRDLAKLCAEHGLRRVLPNELRHTGASLMLDAGLTYDEVADIMGHATTRMLRQRYRHHLQPVRDGHVAAMDAHFGSLS